MRITKWMTVTDLVKRWAAFNAVGALGVVIQLALVGALVHRAQLHYLVATIVAVEAAILHNFAWHQRWTWKDRPAGTGPRRWLTRLLAFNLLNGGISLAGNAAVMALLSGAGGVEPVVANAVAILLCSVANFAASETLVFRPTGVATPPARGGVNAEC